MMHQQQLPQNARGVTYQLRYMGCISINVSMKSLEFDVRTILTKECIRRVCEAANMIGMKKRKLDRQIHKFLPGPPNMEYSGANVYLSISTHHIVVSLLSQPRILFDHPLFDVSFAAGGEEDVMDFIAYVGKDEESGRRCYVFECAVGQADEVIAAIRGVFESRFEQVTSTPVTTVGARGVNQRPTNAVIPPPNCNNNADTTMFQQQQRRRPIVAPEALPRVALAAGSPRSPVLIDFDSSPTLPTSAHSYVNNNVDDFSGAPPAVPPPPPRTHNVAAEPWFHGRLSREDSEMMIRRDGEFVVRISASDPKQLVLTGMQNGVHKHLMLIDDEGKVRTKDREFDSISHLIDHHFKTHTPITSAESALLLKCPVIRRD